MGLQTLAELLLCRQKEKGILEKKRKKRVCVECEGSMYDLKKETAHSVPTSKGKSVTNSTD